MVTQRQPTSTPLPSSVGTLLQLAQHHNAKMNSRRRIGLSMFTGMVLFVLLVTKGIADHIGMVESTLTVKVLSVVVLSVVPAIYAGLMFQIERVSRRDRERYRYYEDWLQALVAGQDYTGTGTFKESVWQTIVSSWATTWTFLGLSGLSAVCAVFVLLLKVPSGP